MKFKVAAWCLFTATCNSAIAADWSANVGWVNDYHYRGIFQSSSSVSAGIDVGSNGFYAGSWAADVGDGLEVDGYFGYGGQLNDVGYSVGFTGYYYTGDFDDTYQEVNVAASWSVFNLDVALGEYQNFSGPTLDYTFTSLSASYNGFYGKLGSFSNDFDGDYFEVGYGKTMAKLDFSIAVIFANEDLLGNSDQSIVFGLTKGFDL